ncbi:MAG: type I restriction enzyme HsdR N-terminal domain-containing protein [Bacteroidales bacterium]|nr:type I restriction enzyme HsdR N-terminal domain-containing protein [Bacteroidales bacterium]
MKEYVKLNFPDYKFKIRHLGTNYEIFDQVRKKFVKLTPEEWVRQHIIHYMIDEKKYRPGLISIERGFMFNELQKRYDVLVYDRTARPNILIECKAPTVEITQATADQAFVYNKKIKAQYIILTNGMQTFCLNCIDEDYEIVQNIPKFDPS